MMYHRIPPFGYGALSQWPVLCDLAIVCVLMITDEEIYTRLWIFVIKRIFERIERRGFGSRSFSRSFVGVFYIYIRCDCGARVLKDTVHRDAVCILVVTIRNDQLLGNSWLSVSLCEYVSGRRWVSPRKDRAYCCLFNVRDVGLKQSIARTLLIDSKKKTRLVNWNGDKRGKERGGNMRKKNLRVVHKQVYDRVQIQQVHEFDSPATWLVSLVFFFLFFFLFLSTQRSIDLRAKPIPDRHWLKLGQNELKIWNVRDKFLARVQWRGRVCRDQSRQTLLQFIYKVIQKWCP